MDHVIPGRLAALAVVLAVAGCAPATDDRPSQAPTTTTTESLSRACTDVADKAQALLTEVGRYATGKASPDQVHTAADALSDSFNRAKTELGPAAQADLDEAGQALHDVLDALTTQPVDKAKLQTAANQVFTALGEAATVCTSGTTAPDTSTESTNSVTTTS